MNTIKVKVKVGKPNSCIVSKGDVWEVNLKSLAEKGKANLELIKLISKELNGRVEIVKGFKSKKKILKIVS